jgi:hypothetical protein
VLVFGLGFNLGNSYANGRDLFSLSDDYAQEWLREPGFGDYPLERKALIPWL